MNRLVSFNSETVSRAEVKGFNNMTFGLKDFNDTHIISLRFTDCDYTQNKYELQPGWSLNYCKFLESPTKYKSILAQYSDLFRMKTAFEQTLKKCYISSSFHMPLHECISHRTNNTNTRSHTTLLSPFMFARGFNATMAKKKKYHRIYLKINIRYGRGGIFSINFSTNGFVFLTIQHVIYTFMYDFIIKYISR